jgi:hypothetical protein
MSGCGGSATPSNLTTAPSGAVFNTYYQSSHSTTSNPAGTAPAYTLSTMFTPHGGMTTFNNQIANSADEIVSLSYVDPSINPYGGGSATVYYTVSPFVPLGWVGSNGIPYGVVTSYSPLPATLTVGQTGSLVTLKIYHDATMAVLDGTQTSSYSVQSYLSTTLLLCIEGSITPVANPSVYALFGYCYLIDSSGAMILYSMGAVTAGIGVVPFP